jgi:hypothetical protein
MEILVAPYIRGGAIVQVIPNRSGMDWLDEYEVDFGQNQIATFYETQLRLSKPPSQIKPAGRLALRSESREACLQLSK